MSKSLNELARVHLALVAILESPLMSETTRRQIEMFREELEREMEELLRSAPESFSSGAHS